MSETFYTILTAIGKAKLANAQVNGTAVNFTTMKAGDGNGAYYSPNESQTDLVNTVWSGSINSLYIDPNNSTYVIIEAVIPEDVGNFYIREVGIFDDAGVLIGIGKYPETYKPTLAQGSGKDLYLRYIMETSNASVVTLKVDPAVVLATKKDVELHNDDATAHLAFRQRGMVKDSVRVATTAEISLSGEQTIDGVAVVAGEAVLVKDQSTGSVNGIYVVSTGAWTRRTDADTSAKLPLRTMIPVREGTVAANTLWILANTTAISLNITDLVFLQPLAKRGGDDSQNFRVAPAVGVNDATPLAQVQTLLSGVNNPYGFNKRESGTPAFVKTGASTLSVKAGTEAIVGATKVSVSVDTAVVMPVLTAGTDYALYACSDNTWRADASFTAPTGYTTANSRMIGGFHYGLTAPGTTVAGGSFATTGNGMIWTQADVDLIAGINAFSLWDLKWRPLCDPKGMALVAGRTWVDIYLCGTNHTTNGTSKAGTDIASGTVLPKKPLEFGGDGTVTYATPMWWDFVEIANAYKKRLLREQEFILAAFGVTENQSIDSTAATYPTTQRNAGYTSKYGLEQASGHHWTWGEDTGMYYDTTTWSWKTSNGGRGQIYTQGTYGLTRVLLGGYRTLGVYSGSRCSDWDNYPWNVIWSIGLRAACDHLALV